MAVQHHTFLFEQYAQQSEHGGFVVGREQRIGREKNTIRVSWRTTSVKDHFILQWTFAGSSA